MARSPIHSWDELPMFSWPDYVILAVMLLASAAIGIYHAFAGGKQKTTHEIHLGSREMHLFPVAMSLLAGFLSSVTLLGIPAEVYMNGIGYWYICLSFLVVIPVVVFVFMPTFYHLGHVSVFQYLEKRFSRSVRVTAFILFAINMMIYMAVVLYGPAIALSAVTRIPIWACILIVGGICTFYTSIGGVKAVVWTDTLQIALMFGGSLAALCVGFYQAGGFTEVLDAASRTGRLSDLHNFNPDPRVRHTFWSVFIGGIFFWTAVYGTNQAQVQRYLCLPTLKDAQKCLWIGLPGFIIMLTTTSWTGLTLYHYFMSCDPLWQGLISAPDQILPLFILETVGHLPGLPGLFVVGVFSGSLSTISSGVNSLAANFLEDCFLIIKPDAAERTQAHVSKIAAVVIGLVCMGCAFSVGLFGQVIEFAYALFGMISGPLLGVFCLGMFFPWSNAKGALVGLLSGLTFIVWIGVGSKVYRVLYPQPVRGRNVDPNVCPPLRPYPSIPNVTTHNAEILDVYEISYMWYGAIGCSSVVLIGLVVSILTGHQDPKDLDPRLTYPLFYKLGFCLPEQWRQKLRCGVRALTPVGSTAKFPNEPADEWKESKGNISMSTIVTDADCPVCAAVSPEEHEKKGGEYEVSFTVI